MAWLRHPQQIPLILLRRTDTNLHDAFAVWSRDALVGTITRTQSGGSIYRMWSITDFYVAPKELGPGAGMADTRGEAMQQFAERGVDGWRELRQSKVHQMTHRLCLTAAHDQPAGLAHLLPSSKA